MRLPLLGALLLVPALAAAGVYRWVGPDGQVNYSDRWVAGSEPVGIREDRRSGAPQSEGGARADGQEATAGSYSRFEIVTPDPNETVRSAEGRVKVSLHLEPPLQPGHRLQILLDGKPVPGTEPTTQMELSGVSFGSHRLQVRIRDESDAQVASSPIVDFHLRKPLPENTLP
jgi:hypothetical protein